VGVVGVARGQVAHGGLRLHLHVVLVVVHLEDGLRGVHDAPDHDGRDLDRVAVVVVDLQASALEVPDAERDVPLAVERVGPSQPRRLDRPLVVSEELHHAAFVRINDEEPEQADEQDEFEHHPGQDPHQNLVRDGADDGPGHEASADQQEQQHGQARDPGTLSLPDHE
jgi:hypothetical protein